jgi:NitT/TauT family transport system permease protein
MAGVFAILVVLSAMGMGLHAIVHTLQRRIVFWTETADERVIGA